MAQYGTEGATCFNSPKERKKATLLVSISIKENFPSPDAATSAGRRKQIATRQHSIKPLSPYSQTTVYSDKAFFRIAKPNVYKTPT